MGDEMADKEAPAVLLQRGLESTLLWQALRRAGDPKCAGGGRAGPGAPSMCGGEKDRANRAAVTFHGTRSQGWKCPHVKINQN